MIGLGFPAGLGLAVYMASGSSLAPPPASASVPTGTIAEPSLPPLTDTTDTTTTDGDVSGNCDELEHQFDPECVGGATTEDTTTDETTTETDTTTTETDTTDTDSSGKGRGRGRGGDSGRGRGRGGGDD